MKTPPPDPMETVTQRRISATDTGFQKPAKAMNSAFDVAKPAKPMVDLTTVPIRSGVPVPISGKRNTLGVMDLINRMQPGDMVELPKTQADSLVRMARVKGVKTCRRLLSATLVRVWRIS